MGRNSFLAEEPTTAEGGLWRRIRKLLGQPASHGARRKRIAAWAIVFGILAALIELPMPAEDAFRAARAELRMHDAPSEIVIVAVDDRTLNALSVPMPSRRQDAELVDQIFAAGAERLVFDRAYADPAGADEDRVFARTLAKHRGRVWLGASPKADNGLQKHEGLLPTQMLRDQANIASMMGQSAPFGLAVRFPTETRVAGESIPSISAVLAGYRGESGWYRPDQSIDPRSIPTVSYVDVLQGNESASLLGKTVVVAPTHLESSDFHSLPFGGKIAGVYFHVMGAHTLKGGLPVDLGWIPATILAAAVLALQARRRRPMQELTYGAAAVFLCGPVGLDAIGINIDVFPALIALGTGAVRLHLFAGRTYNRSTNLLLPSSIARPDAGIDHDVFALKVNNLGDFRESTVPAELGIFIERIIACLDRNGQFVEPNPKVAFEKDTLIWTAPSSDRGDLEEHALGLVAILRSAEGLGVNGSRVDASIGIDVNHGLDDGVRIQAASQAAEMASRTGLRFMSADSQFLAARERRILLLAQIERCIADRTIELGFQPKVCLKTGALLGAEALLRWNHHSLGKVEATELVAAAEDSDRIDDLTVYVLDAALEAGRRALNVDPEFQLAVNVSAKALKNVMILYHVARLLSRHRFPASNLVLEVTETAPLDDTAIENHLEGLLKQGVQLSLDDFGTGHSSLDYLRRIPSSEVKIDRRFVTHMRASDDSAALVQGTIDMAHRLGKDVVAEGVEDELTAERLRAMKCDQAQGFFYSPAIPIDDLLPMVAQRRIAA